MKHLPYLIIIFAMISANAQTRKKTKNPESSTVCTDDCEAMVDELTMFVKTERACCDFFIFNLSISGNKSEAWLEITGRKGVKDFIKTELYL